MTILVQTETIQQSSFQLKCEEISGAPLVEYQGKQYCDLTELVKDAGTFNDATYLAEFVRIANFIFKGRQFNVIENISDYQEKYKNVYRNRLSEYGIYDTSEIKEPFLKDGKAIFFVEHSTIHVPFRVICTYPFTGNEAKYSYSLLKEIV